MNLAAAPQYSFLYNPPQAQEYTNYVDYTDYGVMNLEVMSQNESNESLAASSTIAVYGSDCDKSRTMTSPPLVINVETLGARTVNEVVEDLEKDLPRDEKYELVKKSGKVSLI